MNWYDCMLQAQKDLKDFHDVWDRAERREKEMETGYTAGQLVRVVRCNCSHQFGIGEIVRIKEVCTGNYLAEKLDRSNDWYVMYDEIEPVGEEEKTVEETKDVIINAKVLLELNACEDGFKWFVDNYGKQDVKVKFLDTVLDNLGKISYRQWLHDKFPQLKKKERTFKVGDRFDDYGYEFMLARINGDNSVTLVGSDGKEFSIHSKIVMVSDADKITEDEMMMINNRYGSGINPL